MSDSNVSAGEGKESLEDKFSVLFAQLVMQQANMALMYLGKTAHPKTGQVVKDMDAAQLFIDELEMLEAKTKGNLAKDEAALLKQTLMSLRLAFVEAVESPEPAPSPPKSDTAAAGQPPPAPTPAEEDEHRKKFTKKY